MADNRGLKLADGEVVLADTTSSLSSLIFPLLELLVITGVCWMAVGWMDANGIDAIARNLVVLVWAIAGLTRFVWPLAVSRRRRFIITDRRVLARSRRGSVDSIPLGQIHSARRDQGGISMAVYGFEHPLYFPEVGRSRKVEKILNARLADYSRWA
ncbi:hypothetical protein [Corynebacterium qintianiae]|uniref:hypothetical protein n=1 Tax=Corynebacterium qintianiae TaxID=2709392 RepID=UPI0013EE1806|nr:hypothetical protein [Corynebacterium qintianiae]